MATCTCGGEIGGYCAIGKLNTAIPPASVMRMDSTVAKIGRSMKKCESIIRRSLLLARSLLAEGRHGSLLRLDLHVWPDLLERTDGDPILGVQPVGDDAQAVRLERSRGDAPVLSLVL